MSSSPFEITNLLYRYAECIDTGDLEGAAALFRHARVKVRQESEPMGEAELFAMWRQSMVIHPCGTPRTKHVISNPIIEIDEAAGRATCRSYYTVVQSAEGFPLQIIASGRYHDAFERADGRWRFCERDYSLLDAMGDLTHHLDSAMLAGLSP
jgi:3-phenylpropionate/cinnamic acid dioxygenase small subunit